MAQAQQAMGSSPLARPYNLQPLTGPGQNPYAAQGQVYRGPLDASGAPMQAPGTREDLGGGVQRFTPTGGWGGNPAAQQNLLQMMANRPPNPGMLQTQGPAPRPTPQSSTGMQTPAPARGGEMWSGVPFNQNPSGKPMMPPMPGGAPAAGAGGGKGAQKQAIGQLPGGPPPGAAPPPGMPPGAPGRGPGGAKGNPQQNLAMKQQMAQLPGGPR